VTGFHHSKSAGIGVSRQQSGSAKRYRRRPWLSALMGSIGLTLAGAGQLAFADHQTNDEPYDTGWSLQVDNDLFAGGARDQDYTGGFALTLSGRRVTHYRFTPQRLRTKLERLIGLDHFLTGQVHHSVHALELGAALFTPSDISRSELNPLDRPYASLFFLNSTHQTVLPKRKLSIKSGLTIGVLGLDLAETLQKNAHRALGSETPEGWQHQISSGGELTAKYSLGFQRAAYQRHYANGLAQEINWTGKVDVGFNTGFGTGFNWRFGRINTPWWTFNPHQSEYINLGANVASSARSNERVRERYVYAGSTTNYSVYNAIVQGQFRDRSVAVDRSDVNPLSAEIWGGVSIDVGERLRADIFLRSRTKDIELAESKRLTWGGLTLSRTF